MLRLDPLVHIAAAFEHAQAVRPEDLKHKLLVWVMAAAADEGGLLDATRIRHREGLDVEAREESLREGIS